MSTLRKLILENDEVVFLQNHRAKKDLKKYEAAVRRFLESFEESMEGFRLMQRTLSPEHQRLLATLTKEYESAGKDLGLFLRARRLDLEKVTRER